MIQLQKMKNAELLWLMADLCSAKNNVTQYRISYGMVKWYIWLESRIQTITELEEYIIIST